MKVMSSRTLAAANGSAGSSGGCGQVASIHSRMAWLSHRPPWSVVMNGILPSGDAARTSSSLLWVATCFSAKGTPFSSSASLTLL